MSAAVSAASGSEQEIWSGTYQCSAMESEIAGSPGYTASIRMIVEGSAARIVKESAEIRETMSGEIQPDGSLRLEGIGRRKESAGAVWRYRFDGQFDSGRFNARGMMFSAHLGSKLRDCSMSLARLPGVASAARQQAGAAPEPPAKAAQVLEPSRSAATSSAQNEPERLPQPPRVTQAIEKELDVRDRNDTAIVEGTVSRGVPHRYFIAALKGQRFSAALKSPDGARFDLYEPGSSITDLSGGFVVQGARVHGTAEGSDVDVELPADGKYLLLVRAAKEQAFYTLEMKTSRVAAATAEPWWEHRYTWIALILAALALVGAFVVRRKRKRERRLFRSD